MGFFYPPAENIPSVGVLTYTSNTRGLFSPTGWKHRPCGRRFHLSYLTLSENNLSEDTSVFVSLIYRAHITAVEIAPVDISEIYWYLVHW